MPSAGFFPGQFSVVSTPRTSGSDLRQGQVSHHAIVPNVNVLDDLEQRIARLIDDEKRLLALICRSYLAAVMPDYEYCQTVATMRVPVPGGMAIFKAVGRIPLKQGWKAVYGATEPEPEKSKEGDTEAERTLPQLTNGERATLTHPCVDAKKTQPPPRYNEGTLVDVMQNAWRFVTDDALRERLKEAKGIGTPAMRAEIIKGLKQQDMLTADGKLVVPTRAGLQLFELLKGAAPALVDPGMTAVWEMRLDEVVTGRSHFKGVINEIAAEAGKLIAVLSQYTGALVNLNRPASIATRRARGKAYSKREVDNDSTRTSGSAELKRKLRRSRKTKINTLNEEAPTRGPSASCSPPTTRMVAFAEKLAKDKKVDLPADYARDFEVCRRFLDDHAGR
jgi:DNA topoisomerase III